MFNKLRTGQVSQSNVMEMARFLEMRKKKNHRTVSFLLWILYRLLCNDVQREGAKPSPELASLLCAVPQHSV